MRLGRRLLLRLERTRSVAKHGKTDGRITNERTGIGICIRMGGLVFLVGGVIIGVLKEFASFLLCMV